MFTAGLHETALSEKMRTGCPYTNQGVDLNPLLVNHVFSSSQTLDYSTTTHKSMLHRLPNNSALLQTPLAHRQHPNATPKPFKGRDCSLVDLVDGELRGLKGKAQGRATDDERLMALVLQRTHKL